LRKGRACTQESGRVADEALGTKVVSLVRNKQPRAVKVFNLSLEAAVAQRAMRDDDYLYIAASVAEPALDPIQFVARPRAPPATVRLTGLSPRRNFIAPLLNEWNVTERQPRSAEALCRSYRRYAHIIAVIVFPEPVAISSTP